MSSGRYMGIFLAYGLISLCEGITNNGDDSNLIGEEERRGVDLKKNSRFQDHEKAATQKRGLWIIGQAQPANSQNYPSGYDSSFTENGYHGYTGSGYGATSTGYGYDTGDVDGYHRRPVDFPHGVIGTNYGYSGGDFGHSGFGHSGGGHGVSNYGESHGNDIYKKLALKKLLIPLAGLAILGAAAALSSTNPVLLQLGTISGRRKRSIPETQRDVYPSNPLVKPNLIK